MDDNAVFILTHGRPDRQHTYAMLRRYNYAGRVFFVCDDEDATLDEYMARYGRENILVFSKREVARRVDLFDCLPEDRCIVYARNACFDFARELGVVHFLELDDDYCGLGWRWEEDGRLCEKPYNGNMARLFDAFWRFLDDSGALCVAMAQGGDFIGGCGSKRWQDKLLRKAMNTLFCRTDRRFQFVGRINEDVNTYTSLSRMGRLFFTDMHVMIHQMPTQRNPGGMSENYIDNGTFVKSFYSVIACPSAVKIGVMGNKFKRIHHSVDWNACAPMILAEKYRRAGDDDKKDEGRGARGVQGLHGNH